MQNFLWAPKGEQTVTDRGNRAANLQPVRDVFCERVGKHQQSLLLITSLRRGNEDNSLLISLENSYFILQHKTSYELFSSCIHSSILLDIHISQTWPNADLQKSTAKFNFAMVSFASHDQYIRDSFVLAFLSNFLALYPVIICLHPLSAQYQRATSRTGRGTTGSNE